MTALARRISETPMAPYVDLLRNMKLQEKRIVLAFLQEAMEETPDHNQERSAAEIIRDKFKGLSISQETKDLVRGLSLSSEEMNDERTQYILGH